MSDRHAVPDTTRGAVAFYTDARAWPGGAETYLTGLMRWLRDDGWRVNLFTSDRVATEPWTALLRDEGFPVTRFRPTREIDPRGAREAAWLLRGFDIVHFNKTHPRNCLPAIPAARKAGVPVVVSTEHISEVPVSHYPLGAETLTWLVRRANRFIDRVVVVSETSRLEYLNNYRCPPAKVVAIRGGVDLRAFDRLPGKHAAREALKLPQDAPVAVYVGRLSPRKGQDAAITAVSLLSRRGRPVRLLLVGDGPCGAELRSQAATLGIGGHVTFAGSRADIDVVLAASDVFVLASPSESLSLSVLEAMAAGLPVVATDCGGPSEIVQEGVTGRLVSVGDPVALADAIAAVLGSEDRGAAMGRAGRARAEAEFDVRTTYARVASLYTRLLSETEAGDA